MRTLALAAIAIGLAAPAMAQPVTSIDDGYGAAFPYTPRGGLVPVDTGQGLNAFFYPNGYDPSTAAGAGSRTPPISPQAMAAIRCGTASTDSMSPPATSRRQAGRASPSNMLPSVER